MSRKPEPPVMISDDVLERAAQALRSGALYRNEAASAATPDDGSDVVALAARVGLKGFAPQADAHHGRSNPDEGSDVLALASKAGLKGFADRVGTAKRGGHDA